MLNRFQPTPDQPVYRAYELRVEATAGETGGGRGTACVLGSLDDYKSVWSPRAFGKDVLSTYVQSGFMSNGHNHREDLATIDKASVSGRHLNIDWTWYSTDDAQEMRTKCAERIARGKTVGLSVGVMIDWREVEYFENGEKLWRYCEKVLEEDMSLYDSSIKTYQGFCWIIPKVTRYIETAITQIPAVAGSGITEARSLDDLLRPDSLGELTFEEHLDRVLGCLASVEARGIDIEAHRAPKGGRIGRDNLGRLTAIRDSLNGLIDRSRQPEPEAGSRAFDDALARLRFEGSQIP